MSNERGNAGLPNGFLNKLNDAGVVVESRELNQEKHYLLTRNELTFNEETSIITKKGTVGIGVAFPKDTPVSEVTRVLTHAIPKMKPPRFEGEKMFTMYTYMD